MYLKHAIYLCIIWYVNFFFDGMNVLYDGISISELCHLFYKNSKDHRTNLNSKYYNGDNYSPWVVASLVGE